MRTISATQLPRWPFVCVPALRKVACTSVSLVTVVALALLPGSAPASSSGSRPTAMPRDELSVPPAQYPDEPMVVPASTLVRRLAPAGLIRDVAPQARADRAARSGIPLTALRAYVRAAASLAESDPTCGLRWSLLAAIGRVESNHGRFAGRALLTDGPSSSPIIGIALDGGPGVARITDSDGGAFDGDTTYDRAVGPMQFIPDTWRLVAVDGDGDGRKSPHDIDDAALAAARYLCAGSDLRSVAGLRSAILRYNNSGDYADLVLMLMAAYEQGLGDRLPAPGPVQTVPPAPAGPLPPATVGTPPAVEDHTGETSQAASRFPGADSPPPAGKTTATPTPSPTPTPTPEDTPAPTPEDTPAPTPEDTPAPTPEDTPAPTPEETATPEDTPAPTSEEASSAPPGPDDVAGG
jgi:hypothetical protein